MSTFHWNWISLASGGVLVGYFVALSQSPVVATIMPLLFGLIAGATGFVLGKTDVTKQDASEKLKFWSAGFTAFSLAVLTSSLLALWLTRGVIDSHQPSIDLKGLEAHEAARLVALRKKLLILGADSQEIIEILETEKGRLTRPNNVIAEMRKYLGVFIPVADTLYKALVGEAVQLVKSDREALNSMSALLSATIPILKEWEKADGNAPPIRVSGVALILESIENVVDENVGSTSGDSEKFVALGGDLDLLSAFIQAKASLKVRPGVREVRSRYGDSLYEEVDDLTKLLVSGEVTKERISQYFAYQEHPILRGQGV